MSYNGGYGTYKREKPRKEKPWKIAPLETFTTDEARADWKTMKIRDFLFKYHVSSARAHEALGLRERQKSTEQRRNITKIERVGKTRILELVNEFGAMPVARLLDMSQAAFEFHGLGIGRRHLLTK